MNFSPKHFLAAFAIAAVAVATPFGALQLLLMSVGELCQDCVVDRQLSGEKHLYSSGLDQSSFHYKMELERAVQPEVIAVGSSRSMQVRSAFFNARFINLGGAVNSVGELEALVDLLSHSEHQIKAAFVFVDPWWFNSNYAGSDLGPATLQPPTRMISLSVAKAALAAMKNGNWVAQSRRSNNLGIHAILTGDGFSSDGSYNYDGLITGAHKSSDVAFADTLGRIRNGNLRFEHGERADPVLVRRACAAVKSLKEATGTVVMIAPPFAERVWSEMMQGEYEYIPDAHAALERCADGVSFYDFAAPSHLSGSTDCEFVDGFHGGDVTYARLIRHIAHAEPTLQQYVSTDFVEDFIAAIRALHRERTETACPGPRSTFSALAASNRPAERLSHSDPTRNDA